LRSWVGGHFEELLYWRRPFECRRGNMTTDNNDDDDVALEQQAVANNNALMR
jgi:hypothetical protein